MIFQKNMKTALFDMDGTLVDSMPYWAQKMLNILKDTNTAYPENIINIITPLGDLGTAQYFKDVLKVPLSIDEMFSRMDEYALDKYGNEIPLKAGVFEYLSMLKEKGVSLNVLTASPHKMVDPCLKRNGLYDMFDNVYSSDDFGMTKSNPQIYVAAVERIGSKINETVFFDDNLTAVKTAKQAGLFTVGVYDDFSRDDAETIKEIADLYIGSFDALCQKKAK